MQFTSFNGNITGIMGKFTNHRDLMEKISFVGYDKNNDAVFVPKSELPVLKPRVIRSTKLKEEKLKKLKKCPHFVPIDLFCKLCKKEQDFEEMRRLNKISKEEIQLMIDYLKEKKTECPKFRNVDTKLPQGMSEEKISEYFVKKRRMDTEYQKKLAYHLCIMKKMKKMKK